MSLLLISSLVFGCGLSPRPTVSELQATLPTQVDGEPLVLVQVVDESLLSGHAIDDALNQLGKSRDEASVVFLDSSLGTGGVGAAAVDGVDGTGVLEAALDTWHAAAVVAKSQEAVGGRPVWLIVERDGYRTYAYALGRVVYFAQSGDPARAQALAEALP